MKRLFLIFLLFSNLVYAKVQVYFSPSRDCINVLIKEINSSSKTIKIAIYDFTNKEIRDAILSAHKRGVKVSIFAEKRNDSRKNDSVLGFLSSNKINVKFSTERKQHNKYAIFDDKKVFTGSANWTYSAFKKNFENCILFDDQEAVDSFIRNFQNISN